MTRLNARKFDIDAVIIMVVVAMWVAGAVAAAIFVGFALVKFLS